MKRFFLSVCCLLILGTLQTAQAQDVVVTTDSYVNFDQLPAGTRAAVAVVCTVPDGYHAQSAKPLDPDAIPFVATIKTPAGIKAGTIIYGKPLEKNYEGLGKLSVYVGTFTTFIPIDIAPDAAAGDVEITGSVSFQICDDKGTCLPPEEVKYSIKTKIVAAGTEAKKTNNVIFKDYKDANPTTKPAATQPASSSIAPTTNAPTSNTPTATTSAPDTAVSLFGWSFNINGIGIALAAALGAGLIFNVMPCVLPVLPLKAWGFFEAAGHHRGKTISFGLMFAAGMVSLFSLLGVVVFFSTSIFHVRLQWGQWFAYPAFVWTVAIVITLLGIWLMGFFALNLPSSVYGFNFRHDTFGGNFAWGAFTAILSTPCTAPMFPAVIAFALTQPGYVGILVMATVGIGMAIPYVILSAFPEIARKFPRTGPFAEIFKQSMGVLMLATAAWFVGLGIHMGEQVQWWLVFAVIAIGAAYIIYRSTVVARTKTGVFATSVFATISVAVALALTLFMTRPTPAHWQPFTDEAFAAARHSNNPVLVKFTADWCLNCKYIEHTVFTDPVAIDELTQHRVVMLKADLTSKSAPGWKMRESLGGTGIPFTAIYAAHNDAPVTLASVYTTGTLVDTLKGIDK